MTTPVPAPIETPYELRIASEDENDVGIVVSSDDDDGEEEQDVGYLLYRPVGGACCKRCKYPYAPAKSIAWHCKPSLLMGLNDEVWRRFQIQTEVIFVNFQHSRSRLNAINWFLLVAFVICFALAIYLDVKGRIWAPVWLSIMGVMLVLQIVLTRAFPPKRFLHPDMYALVERYQPEFQKDGFQLEYVVDDPPWRIPEAYIRISRLDKATKVVAKPSRSVEESVEKHGMYIIESHLDTRSMISI